MGTILLVRHSQASFGSGDYDVLSDLGVRQTQALHESLEQRGVRASALVSGSLRRQIDTARPWRDAGAKLRTDPRWDEYDAAAVLDAHGVGMASLERRADDPTPPLSSREFQAILDRALRGWVAAGADSSDSASWAAFRASATGALEVLAAELSSGETGLAFTSGGVIAAICVAVLGLDEQSFVALNRVAVNAAVTKLVTGRSGTTLISFNEHAHLEREGLVTYR
jgi:broad specificity phosphatase PhoE